jgi:hypothetical protein
VVDTVVATVVDTAVVVVATVAVAWAVATAGKWAVKWDCKDWRQCCKGGVEGLVGSKLFPK